MPPLARAIAILVACVAPAALAQDCASPVSPAAFQSAFNAIAVQPTNQKKLERATELVSGSCLLAAQVKSIALLFSEDAYRYEFCALAFRHTYDRVNFYEVYDTFQAVSIVFRLHDQVAATRGPDTPPAPAPAPEPTFHPCSYPSPEKYTGKRGCEGPPVGDDVFLPIARNVFRQPTDEARLVAIQVAAEQRALSMAQLMKLASLVNVEHLRLRALVGSFARVYDQGNYAAASALFATPHLQAEWTTHAKAILAAPPPAPPPPARTSDADFGAILREVREATFKDEKLRILRLATKDRWFGVEQIRTFSREFPFGDAKIAVFKLLHPRCTERDDYYKLLNELTFESEKEELTRFLKGAGK